MHKEHTTYPMIAALCVAIAWMIVVESSGTAQEQKNKGGTIIGELKSQKDTPDRKNTVIEVLAPGEEKARRYHVLYDQKLKGPMPSVLAAVRAAKVGDLVEFEWVSTGHGPAIKSFQLFRKGQNHEKK